jgi:hypothetical protein
MRISFSFNQNAIDNGIDQAADFAHNLTNHAQGLAPEDLALALALLTGFICLPRIGKISILSVAAAHVLFN